MPASDNHVPRRTVLRLGAATVATALLGGTGVLASARRAAADVVDAELFALAGERTMIDGLVVPVLGFGSTPDRVELPAGRLEVETGDTVNLTIVNRTNRRIGLSVPRIPAASASPLAPGATRTIPFTAPARAGTYYYVGTVDGSAATGRALGATGVLVVRPRDAGNSLEASFPGVRRRARRQLMYGTMPVAATLPVAWVQERSWLFAELNPATARELAGGRVALPSDPEPEYFLINGISGMLAVEDPSTYLKGRAGGLGQAGDSTLLRMVNTGRAPRSVHTHGNHFWVLSHPDTPWIVGAMKDTVRVPAGGAVDVLIPFETPPDSYPVTGRAQKYVVHDHIEMAETASGGHYPSGMVSEILFD